MKGEQEMTAMRSLKRSVAHHRMVLAGYSRVNKHAKGSSSFFSKIWQDYLDRTSIKNHRHNAYRPSIVELSK